jgi:DnaK suppressor protein
MKHLDNTELEELRDALEVELATIEEELAEHGRVRTDNGQWEAMTTGSDGEEADQTDIADNIEELATNIPLVSEWESRHREVLHAIKLMDTGLYGLCSECGEEIPFDRLEANPAAVTCVEHTE